MGDEELREEIERLEDRIEALAGSIESCRKFILASRVAIGAGGILLVALVIGAIGFDPLAMVAGLAAVLGGIVLLGSNNSTLQQAAAALKVAEAERAQLIGSIDLRVVNGGGAIWDVPGSRTLH